MSPSVMKWSEGIINIVFIIIRIYIEHKGVATYIFVPHITIFIFF